MNNDSILSSIKKLLGMDDGYEAFDQDIIIHINSVFATLSQMGVHTFDTFRIKDKLDLWSEVLNTESENYSANLEMVKTYTYLRVRLVFDPPANGTLVKEIREQIKEYEWRINLEADVLFNREEENSK